MASRFASIAARPSNGCWQHAAAHAPAAARLRGRDSVRDRGLWHRSRSHEDLQARRAVAADADGGAAPHGGRAVRSHHPGGCAIARAPPRSASWTSSTSGSARLIRSSRTTGSSSSQGSRGWMPRPQGRFGADFAALDEAQKTAICDDICYVPRASRNLPRPPDSSRDIAT